MRVANLQSVWLSVGLAGLLVGCGAKEDEPGVGGFGMMGPTAVVAQPVGRERVAESLSLVGTLEADEMVEIKAEAPGIVERILFEEGQNVAAGDILIELDRQKLESAYQEALANHKLSQTELARSRELREARLISQQEFDQAASREEVDGTIVELRRRQLRDAQVVAPFSGVVGTRNVSPGQVIAREETLTWLVDLDQLKARFNVPERFLGVAQKGQSIAVRVAAYPEREFIGSVYFLAPFVDINTRNIEVKAIVPNPERLLIPGMFANLELTLTIREDALVIPEMAIFRTLEDDQAMVYIVDDQQQAALRTITIGERMAGKIEVARGLEEGDLVITEGTQKIGPGAPVVVSGQAAVTTGTDQSSL